MQQRHVLTTGLTKVDFGGNYLNSCVIYNSHATVTIYVSFESMVGDGGSFFPIPPNSSLSIEAEDTSIENQQKIVCRAIHFLGTAAGGEIAFLIWSHKARKPEPKTV